MIEGSFAVTYIGNLLLFFSLFFSVVSIRFVRLVFTLLTSCLLLLVYGYIVSDFSILNVYLNSSTNTPLLYKVSSVWASSDGSMLFFVWMLSLYNFIYTYVKNKELQRVTLEIQSFICALFVLFVLLAANPFQANHLITDEGLGLNPLLQDSALAIHPPILYFGYTGSSIIFSLVLAYCYNYPNKLNIAQLIKPWVLLSWSFLTLGIGLGSWWAYRELGWGGFWFWDPVENISLIPWLLGLALLHTVNLTIKRNILYHWVILLSIMIFVVSLVGTFSIRSGFLNSIHAFAGDIDGIKYMMVILILIAISGIASYINFYKHCDKGSICSGTLLSYENALLLNNCFLVTATIAISIGVLYPVLMEYFTSTAVIIPGLYYNNILKKILLPFLLLWIVGTQLAVKSNKSAIINHFISFSTSMIIVISLYNGNVIISLLLLLSIWLLISMLISYVININLFTISLSCSLLLARRLGKSYYAMLFAHCGAAILIVGIICMSQFSLQKEKYMQIDEDIKIGRYNLKLESVKAEGTQNYTSIKAIFNVNNSFSLTPEMRFYTVEKQIAADVDIHRDFLSDIYIVISEIDEQLGVGVQVYYNYCLNLVWLGVLLMSIAGVLAIIGARNNMKKGKVL